MIPSLLNRWVALRARFADCPFAQPLADPDGKIGHHFPREYAAATGARVDPGQALIPDLSRLRCADFSPERVDPLIREFYEQTAAFSLSVRGGWRFPFTVSKRLYGSIAERLQQLVVPDLERGIEYEMQSELWLVDHDRDGVYDFRLWLREMKETGALFYVGAVMDFVLDGHAYVTVAFPLWRANLAVVLRCQNLPGGGFALDTRGGAAEWAGSYLVVPGRRSRFSMVRLPGSHESFRFEARRAGSTPYVAGTHTARLQGREALVLDYCIARAADLGDARAHSFG